MVINNSNKLKLPDFPLFDFEVLLVGISAKSKIGLVGICEVIWIVVSLLVDSEGGLGIGVGFVLYEYVTAVPEYWTIALNVF